MRTVRQRRLTSSLRLTSPARKLPTLCCTKALVPDTDFHAGGCQGVSDVDLCLSHEVVSGVKEGVESAAPASPPFTVCQALNGSFT